MRKKAAAPIIMGSFGTKAKRQHGDESTRPTATPAMARIRSNVFALAAALDIGLLYRVPHETLSDWSRPNRWRARPAVTRRDQTIDCGYGTLVSKIGVALGLPTARKAPRKCPELP